MAKELQEYADYRKALGYAKKSIRLLGFDRYLKVHNVGWQDLNPEFFLKLRNNIATHPNTANRNISELRSLFNYLVRRGVIEQNPLKDIPPRPERYFVPFVFSPEQTDQLLAVASENIRKRQKDMLFDMAIYLALVMLVRCGMRINEPLRLLRHHYRADDGTVYIERTKFRKDRLVPVPRAVLTQIENYLSLRSALSTDDKNPFFLAGRRLWPLKDYHIRNAFHKAVEQIGLNSRKKTMGNITFGQPMPHSLRHSFAINTLNRIKQRGISPQQALPVLAAYMGHRKYQYTGAYLKVKSAFDLAGLIEFTKSQLDVI